MRLRGGGPTGSEKYGRPQCGVALSTRQSSTLGSPQAVVRLAGPRPHSLAHKCTQHPGERSDGLPREGWGSWTTRGADELNLW